MNEIAIAFLVLNGIGLWFISWQVSRYAESFEEAVSNLSWRVDLIWEEITSDE